MTTFGPLEASLQDSRPRQLFTLALGSTVFRYSNGEGDFTINSNTYTPLAISATSTAQGQDEKTRAVEVIMPSDNDFARNWKVRPPGQSATATIVRVQIDEAPLATETLEFKGFINGVKYPDTGRIARVQVTSLESLVRRPVPRFFFGPRCNHFLYDSGCAVSTAAHRFVGTVTAETGNVITVPGVGAFSAKFPSGFVKPSAIQDFRTIRAQSGDDLTLKIPFPFSLLGVSVDCQKGCNHRVDGDCLNEYDNVDRFGGDHASPRQNIFETGL